MPTTENYLRSKIQNLETELTRLQRDFDRLRTISGSGNSSYVPESRRINAGQGLIGGGDLSSDKTLSIQLRSGSGLRFDAQTGGLYVDSSVIPVLIAGDGLKSDVGGKIAINLRSPQSGLAFDQTTRALYVNTGDGLQSTSGNVSVRLRTSNSGLGFENGALYVNTGNGLQSTSGNVSVRLRTSDSGLGFENGALYVDATSVINIVAGAGLFEENGKLNVKPGNLISINSNPGPNQNSVQISHNANSQYISTTSTSTTPAWRNLSALAGQGLGYNNANDRFDIGAGNLITVLTDSIKIQDGTSPNGDQVISTPSGSQTPQWTLLSTYAGSGLNFQNSQFNVVTNDVETLASFGLHIASDSVTLGYSTNPGRSSQILASAPNGGLLTLANLDIKQVATFEQGTGNFRVLNTSNVPIFEVDNYQLNVGINTGNAGPDPQFALDVNGPLRATYLIGPHAIQIEKLSMIAHFDGANENGPFGESNGHMGQIGFKNGGVFFYREPHAKFNKAVGFALNSINYVKNPSFEFDNIETNSATSWTFGTLGGQVTPKIAIINSFYFVGDKSCQVGTNTFLQTASGQGYTGTVVTGDVFYAQVRIYRINPLGAVTLSITNNNGMVTESAVSLPTNNSDGGGEWEYLWTSWTVNTTASNIGIRIENLSGGAIYVDAAQLEYNTFNPYFDGSLGGYSNNERVFSGSTSTAWQGIAHNSNSLTHPAMTHPITQNSENNQRFISYNTNRLGLITSVGSVFAWVHILDVRTSSGVNYFEVARTFEVKDQGSAYDNSLVIRVSSTGVLQVYILGILFSATIPGGISSWLRKWCFITVTWEQGVFRLYFNGTLVKTHQAFFQENLSGEISFTDSEGNEQKSLFSGFSEVEGDFNTLQSVPANERFANTIRIGPGRGFIDEFGIVQRALPEDEVRSIYESNSPVFAETSTFNFRPTPDGLVWADDRGLWVQRKDGKPAFGIFAGSDPSYTWGGIALNQGDVLIGGTPNYMRFQPDNGRLVINAQKQTGTGVGVGFVLDSEEGISIRIPPINLAETPLGINSYSFVENTTQVASISLWRSNQNRTLQISTIDNTNDPLTPNSSSIVIAPGLNNPLTLRTRKGGASDVIQMTPNQLGPGTGDNQILIKTFGNLNLEAGGTSLTHIDLLSTGIIHLWAGAFDMANNRKIEIYNESPGVDNNQVLNLKIGRITSTQDNRAGIEVGTSFVMRSSNFVSGVTGFFLGDRRATALQDVLIQATWDGTLFQPATLNVRANTSVFLRRHNGTTPLIAQLLSTSTTMDVRDGIFYSGSTATIGSPAENITITDNGQAVTGGRRYAITRGSTPGTYASGTNVTGRASTTNMIVGKSQFEGTDETTQVEFYQPIGLRPQISNTVSVPVFPFVRMYIKRNSSNHPLLIFAFQRRSQNDEPRYAYINLHNEITQGGPTSQSTEPN